MEGQPYEQDEESHTGPPWRWSATRNPMSNPTP
jgi:hypothetical protein